MSKFSEKFQKYKEFTSEQLQIKDRYLSSIPFPIDPFQDKAINSFLNDNSVLVAAPTGSGKTIVGEFAVFATTENKQRCFYTTPIKALSNQKYLELASRFGSSRVGLLTGDNSINGDGQIVVMTTEVLRNMIYQNPEKLHDLGSVVLDEVHFLSDKERGVVWEEILILLPQAVKIVALSATVSNVEDFAEWLNNVRGDCTFVIEEKRPVPLTQAIATTNDLIPLISIEDPKRLNTKIINLYKRNLSKSHNKSEIPTKMDVVDILKNNKLLPSIYFIFSRNGCDQGVKLLLKSNMRLTSEDERKEIESIIRNRFDDIASADWSTLQIDEWIECALRGFGSHHAGLIPQLKEVTELLFQKGLMKVVFATETLAVGVNMPAKSVVLERVDKWNGDSHVSLTPAEFTQLTGRAGRRGIDISGTAVIAFHPDSEPRFLLNLISSRIFEITSRFTPKYNMLLNLLEHRNITATKTLLNKSFAQFTQEKSNKRIKARIDVEIGLLEMLNNEIKCEIGNFEDYYTLVAELNSIEKGFKSSKRDKRKAKKYQVLDEIEIGSVIKVKRSGKYQMGLISQIMKDRRKNLSFWVVLENSEGRKINSSEIDLESGIINKLLISKGNDFSKRETRKQFAKIIKDLEPKQVKKALTPQEEEDKIQSLRKLIRIHPCHGCHELYEHLRIADKRDRTARSVENLNLGYKTSMENLSKKSDEVLKLLTEIDYVSVSEDRIKLNNRSMILKEIHSDQDLLTCEVLLQNVLNDLTVEEIPAILSSFIYQPRRDEYEIPSNLSNNLRTKAKIITKISQNLIDLESKYGLEYVRLPHFGVAEQIKQWASGDNLQKVLRNSDLAPGDFVRVAKQTADLLRQISKIKYGDVSQKAKLAINKINRGVVAYEPLVVENIGEEEMISSYSEN